MILTFSPELNHNNVMIIHLNGQRESDSFSLNAILLNNMIGIFILISDTTETWDRLSGKILFAGSFPN